MNNATSVLGTIRNERGFGTVRMEEVFDATTPEELWSALTEPSRLAAWLAVVEGDLRVGGTFTARFTSGWEGTGRVDICETHREIVTTMSPGEEGETVIAAVLTSEGDGTRLIVEERGLPLDEIASYGAGWQAHIEDLVAHLAGSTRGDWNARWSELTPHYTELSKTAQS